MLLHIKWIGKHDGAYNIAHGYIQRGDDVWAGYDDTKHSLKR